MTTQGGRCRPRARCDRLIRGVSPSALPAWSLFPARRTLRRMSPLDALGFAPMAPDMERVEAALRASVRAEDPFLSDVAGHLIAAGGKRLRPALAVCAAYSAKGLGPVSDDAITGGVSVELVHLGSLYHDDVIDEAETRRGVPSVNARWSTSSRSSPATTSSPGPRRWPRRSAPTSPPCSPPPSASCAAGRSSSSSTSSTPTARSRPTPAAISGKTAALFATACRVGGLVSAVDDPTLEALTTFGFHLGMCFQVVDDVLDVTGTDESLGKPAGNDILEGVYTLPVIHALAASPELRDLLGRKIDRDALPRARGARDRGRRRTRAIETAREHAADARAWCSRHLRARRRRRRGTHPPRRHPRHPRVLTHLAAPPRAPLGRRHPGATPTLGHGSPPPGVAPRHGTRRNLRTQPVAADRASRSSCTSHRAGPTVSCSRAGRA